MPAPVLQVDHPVGHVGQVVPDDPPEERPVLDGRDQPQGLFREAVPDHALVKLPAAFAEPHGLVGIVEGIHVGEGRVEVVHVASRVDEGVDAGQEHPRTVDRHRAAHVRVVGNDQRHHVGIRDHVEVGARVLQVGARPELRAFLDLQRPGRQVRVPGPGSAFQFHPSGPGLGEVTEAHHLRRDVRAHSQGRKPTHHHVQARRLVPGQHVASRQHRAVQQPDLAVVGRRHRVALQAVQRPAVREGALAQSNRVRSGAQRRDRPAVDALGTVLEHHPVTAAAVGRDAPRVVRRGEGVGLHPVGGIPVSRDRAGVRRGRVAAGHHAVGLVAPGFDGIFRNVQGRGVVVGVHAVGVVAACHDASRVHGVGIGFRHHPVAVAIPIVCRQDRPRVLNRGIVLRPHPDGTRAVGCDAPAVHSVGVVPGQDTVGPVPVGRDRPRVVRAGHVGRHHAMGSVPVGHDGFRAEVEGLGVVAGAHAVGPGPVGRNVSGVDGSRLGGSRHPV